MPTVHDLLVKYKTAQDNLDKSKADQAAARQHQTEADANVAQDEQAVADAVNAVKAGLATTGATYIAKDDGTPQVEADGSVQIFEPDATTNGWHVTVARPSNLDVGGQPAPATPPAPVDQPSPPIDPTIPSDQPATS